MLDFRKLLLIGVWFLLPAIATASVNGSEIPAVAQITDAQSNVWTVESGVVYENGGKASYSANVTMLLYSNGVIYQQNAAGLWWSWNGSGWVFVPDPRTVSVSGSSVPTSTQLVDGALNVWSVAAGVVYENGAPAGYSASVTKLLYNNGVIYQENASDLWWSWSGGTWVFLPNPQPIGAAGAAISANGASIPGAAQLVDGAYNVWTVAGGVVYKNGSAAGYSANVTKLVYSNGAIYQENAIGHWWSWDGSTWVLTSDPLSTAAAAATPAATPAPVPTSTPATTPAAAPAATPAAGSILIDAGAVLGTIGATQIGVNLAAFSDITQGGVTAAVSAVGAHFVRWPGGSNSDAFHWQTQGYCTQKGAWMNPNSTYDNFNQEVVNPGGLEAAVTVNYGSNLACNGGGSPAEAAAWVAYSKSKGYNAHHWTVGNEVYGGWELDLHAKANDAGTYASAVGGSGGYYQLMKNADASAQVGVVVEGTPGSWDETVLSAAPYDFVELHWYAQQSGSESDSYLLLQAPGDLKDQISTLRGELASAGKGNVPILIGEFNSVNTNPGKQTTSIVNALFMGMSFGEILNNGVQMATAWFGYGGGCGTGGNNSGALYGWQGYGAYDEVSDGWSCGSSVANGTLMPSGNAEYLASQFALPGGKMLAATVGSGLSTVRAYAASNGSGGYNLMVFNLSESASVAVGVNLTNAPSSTFSATALTYGKAQYDNSKNNVWSGTVSQALGTFNGATTLTLPPWSMTVLKLN